MLQREKGHSSVCIYILVFEVYSLLSFHWIWTISSWGWITSEVQTRNWTSKVASMEKEMATHSSILAWKSPWTEEPGGLQSMGLHVWACVHKSGGRWVGSNKLVELKKKKKEKWPLWPKQSLTAVSMCAILNYISYLFSQSLRCWVCLTFKWDIQTKPDVNFWVCPPRKILISTVLNSIQELMHRDYYCLSLERRLNLICKRLKESLQALSTILLKIHQQGLHECYEHGPTDHWSHWTQGHSPP